jgi:hypothetical protein
MKRLVAHVLNSLLASLSAELRVSAMLSCCEFGDCPVQHSQGDTEKSWSNSPAKFVLLQDSLQKHVDRAVNFGLIFYSLMALVYETRTTGLRSFGKPSPIPASSVHEGGYDKVSGREERSVFCDALV